MNVSVLILITMYFVKSFLKFKKQRPGQTTTENGNQAGWKNFNVPKMLVPISALIVMVFEDKRKAKLKTNPWLF